MAYHLSQEARVGLAEFRIPRDFGQKLFDFQVAAVKIAAHHLNKRDGVLIGDVVGLGKTLMATAVARIFEDDHGLETLIICPKNLVSMWEDYRQQYRLRAKVLSISRVIRELPELRRYRLVLIDESHNLRNRTGKRYRAIQEYIRENESKVILLTATPYNKTYLDLANQLRLFIPDELDLGMRPEKLLRELTETEFQRRHQCPVRSLAAFEKSEYADDWRELMRLYLVRRTRTFIKDNYAHTDPATGRSYLTFEDGSRSWFPDPAAENGQVHHQRQGSRRPVRPSVCKRRGPRDRAPQLAPLRSGQLRPGNAPRAADADRSQGASGLVSGGPPADGLLPDEPLQTAGKRRQCVHPVDRAPHFPELRLPLRHRSRPAVAHRHTGRSHARCACLRRRRRRPKCHRGTLQR